MAKARGACIRLGANTPIYAAYAPQQMRMEYKVYKEYKGVCWQSQMHVQVLHDKSIRLLVSCATGSVLHVPVEKQLVTAMGKNVADTWSTEEATVNLSPNPLMDIVLSCTAPHKHHIIVSSVLDDANVVGLHQITVDGRHIVSEVLCDMHCVLGAEAIAKHLIAKHCSIPQMTYHTHAMRSYKTQDECVQHFQQMLVATESARRRTDVRRSTVQTVGSPAFRLFHRFNTTSTSKITSAFPALDLDFAQSVCLATAFLANASNEWRTGVVLAHSLQQLAVDAPTAQHLRELGARALKQHTLRQRNAPAGVPGTLLPEDITRDITRDLTTASTTEYNARLKCGDLSILCESGDVFHTPFVTLDADTTRLLAQSGIQARRKTPLYMAFDRQFNAILVGDVCMDKSTVYGGGVSLNPRTAMQQAVADMHFVNVSTAYHRKLDDRRQVLLNKTCASLAKPSVYTSSIFNMLRFERGPMLALLAEKDL